MSNITPILEIGSTDVRGKITLLSSENGIDIFRVSITFPDHTVTTPVTVCWEEEFLNILHIWTPVSGRFLDIKQWYGPRGVHSDFCDGAPILSAIGRNGSNTATVSVSDTCTPITVLLGAKNSARGENLAVYKVTFFDRPCRPVTDYTADIRIDRRPVPFHEAVLSVYPWWKNYGYTVPACPPAAEEPLYSTWYSCCQNPIGKDILSDLALAAEAGFKTVILDDGWQIEGESAGDYSTCGNWIVAKDKFPDFKAFVDGVHSLGMKLMVWFSTSFIGYDAPQYSKFEKKILYKNDSLRFAVLDPRYLEVRKFIKDTYKRFLREYDVDGLKLDFIGAFRPSELTAPFCADDGMDCEFVEDATKLLLSEITGELAAIKPDLLYEYRQDYIGPAINGFGNMLRVGDCAYDTLTNRIGMVNLRLMGYPIAVHSDMLCWSPAESTEICAKHLLNVLFCVPQISVFLTDITAEQRRLLKHFISYFTENKDTLLHGKFCALNPEYNYTYICAESEHKLIAVIYNDTPFVFTGKSCDVHLNGGRDGLVFENTTDTDLCGEIYNCFGELIQTVEIPANVIVRLPVPETGMLRCR